MTAESDKVDSSVLLEFMYRLAQALIACGEQTAKVELILRRMAAANGARRSRVVAFPTAILISFQVGAEEKVTIAEGPTQSLRLDQISDVYHLADAAQRGDVSPREGINGLNEILRKSARFGMIGGVLGHTILSVGVAMILAPALVNLGVAAILGAIVGVVKLFNRNRPVLDVPLPVIAAALVSSLVFLALERGLPINPLYVLVPPLVSFLPGGMLTLGMVELAYGDMVSGASRLMTGIVQLVLLVFGLAAGALIVGYTPESLSDAARVIPLEPWMSWLGVVVFGIGAYLHFSAPRNSFWWMLLVLIVAFSTQKIASEFVGSAGGGFFGMLVATPLGYLIQLRFKGPPAMVTFLPSFWLLVPGALGLMSITRMLNNRDAGIDGLLSAVFVFTSIALGTLMGASLYKWLTERFNWWQLQMGRAGRYFRQKPKK